MSRSTVEALSELYSPFSKGGNFPFIAAIASGLFPKKANLGHPNNNGPDGKIEIKASYLLIFTPS